VSFRTRLFCALVLAVVIPLAALAYGVRREMESRLTAEYQERVGTLASVIEGELEREGREVGNRLAALSSDLSRDNRFRLALRGEPSSRHYLLDYAGEAMRLSGLALFQIQDHSGRILSSGHFRNQFDQSQPELPRFLTAVGTAPALVRARTPEGSIVALARLDSFRVAGQQFTLVGGIEAARLLSPPAPARELSVSLVYPGTVPFPASESRMLRKLELPYIDLVSGSPTPIDTAGLVISQSLGTLEQLRRSVDRWLLVALALSVAIAVIGAALLSSRISRPLRDLAGKTANIDLDRLDQSFESDRKDEIGALSRLLGSMTDRLRVSSARLRDAERRAAVGDLARQINHDIKNGLTPIRNVLRHLTQVVRDDPGILPRVFEERRGTLESGIDYLDTLARNYARLSPELERRPCDVNAIVGQVLRNTASDQTELRVNLGEHLPPVLGDSLMLRRILENLVGNAVDSVAGRSERAVTISTQLATTAAGQVAVRITVADTGPGMTRAELDRVFNDFYSSKPGGTGLGLSIVRRLILDLNGTLRVETEPGTGTRVMVELPAGPTGERAA
jgi:two-component system nitrogen regulation sensor histidine kinase NtrY